MILLRTLTKKSKIGEGKYKDLTIEEILNKDREYLVYIYYKYQHLTFLKEIIIELKISEEYQIGKPGINKDMYYTFLKETAYYKENKKTATLINKQKTKNFLNKENRKYSKSELQNINHGKTNQIIKYN